MIRQGSNRCFSSHLFSPPADADALRHDLQSRLASSQQIQPPDHELVGFPVGWDDHQLIEGELTICNRLKALLVYKFEVRFGTMLGIYIYIYPPSWKTQKQNNIFQIGWGGVSCQDGNFTGFAKFYQICNEFGTF